MKRVIRDVIKIVTIIRWLPADGEPLTQSLDRIGLETEDRPPYVSSYHALGEIIDDADQFSSYVCCTYILVYRVLDH
jgi:hypothetical protein